MAVVPSSSGIGVAFQVAGDGTGGGAGGLERTLSPIDCWAFVLANMRRAGSAFSRIRGGGNVVDAVVAVPTHFNDLQRKAIRAAAAIAGLNVKLFINEPTAAAIAYGVDHADDDEKTILVLDLGGASFSVTIMSIDNGIFDILAENSDRHFGGIDFIQRVVEHYTRLYEQKQGERIAANSRAGRALVHEVEKAKQALSSPGVRSVAIEIPAFFKDGSDFVETLSRVQFEAITANLFQRLASAMKGTMRAFYMDLEEVNNEQCEGT